MGSYSIASYAYYTLSGGNYGSKNGYDTVVSTYDEVGGTVDNFLRPGEVVDPDYSGDPATYIGRYNDGSNEFVVMEDEFGIFFASVDVLPDSSFPASIPESSVDTTSGSGFTEICFAAGTEIATPSGPIRVEMLSVGDPILTADGNVVPVKWVGRQTLHKRFTPRERFEPVRIQAGALGEGSPVRDLVLTADHALFLCGVLANAGALVNGTTITRVPSSELRDRTTYYHVETEGHDLILAEGAAAETFVDHQTRRLFDNYDDYVSLYGEDRQTIPEAKYPRVLSQRQLPDRLRGALGVAELVA